MSELQDIATLVQTGGNTALLVALFVIWRMERRMARIEAFLQLALEWFKFQGKITGEDRSHE